MTAPYDFTTGSGYVDAFRDLKVWEQTFVLSPTRWRTARSPLTLSWDRVPFAESSKSNIPTERGLYAFIIEHTDSYFPPHGYIMYIGITGDTSTARNLRVRFGDYLRDAKKKKGGRSKIVVMLNQFNDDVHFHFAPLPDRSQSLKDIEDDLLAAVIPPCNEDFVADIAPAVRALR